VQNIQNSLQQAQAAFETSANRISNMWAQRQDTEQQQQQQAAGPQQFVVRQQGRPGQVKKVQLINFMSHEYFATDFG
jgi:hypothetical protein